MDPLSIVSAGPFAPLTTEQLVDLLTRKSADELAATKTLHVRAYPFSLYPSEDPMFYCTYDSKSLPPRFPGLALRKTLHWGHMSWK